MKERTHMQRRKITPSGFSLIEVMIALTILTVGILAVVGIFPFIFKVNSDAWNTQTASLLAQEKLNEILEGKAFIAADSYSSDVPSNLPGFGGYRRWIGVNSGSTMCQYVYVQVRWFDKGRIRELCLVGSIFSE